MDASVATVASIPESRKCAGCLTMLPIVCFYRKGSRWDSKCKKCVGAKKKKAYRAKKRKEQRKSAKTLLIPKIERMGFSGKPDVRLLANRLMQFVGEELL